MMTTPRHDMTRSKTYHILFILLPLLLLPNIATAQQTRSETDGRSREELVKLRKQYEETRSGSLSEAQAAKCLEREQQLKSQLAEIDEETMTELRKQIPARKLVNYQQVQREFARKYIKRSQLNRSNRR